MCQREVAYRRYTINSSTGNARLSIASRVPGDEGTTHACV